MGAKSVTFSGANRDEVCGILCGAYVHACDDMHAEASRFVYHGGGANQRSWLHNAVAEASKLQRLATMACGHEVGERPTFTAAVRAARGH